MDSKGFILIAEKWEDLSLLISIVMWFFREQPLSRRVFVATKNVADTKSRKNFVSGKQRRL